MQHDFKKALEAVTPENVFFDVEVNINGVGHPYLTLKCKDTEAADVVVAIRAALQIAGRHERELDQQYINGASAGWNAALDKRNTSFSHCFKSRLTDLDKAATDKGEG